jgi:hypothetical protein
MGDDGGLKLRKLLETDARVDPAIAAYMSTALKMDSVSDFVNYFSEDTFHAGVQDEILDNIEAHKNDKIMRGRLRTAWEIGRAELTKSLAKMGNLESVEDLDALLDPSVQTSQQRTFLSVYNLKLDPEVTPCDTLFARVFREMKRGQLSAIPLIKIKTLAQTAPIMQTVKKQRISETLSIHYQETVTRRGSQHHPRHLRESRGSSAGDQ